jgi:glucose/arabinose dehydrogenase
MFKVVTVAACSAALLSGVWMLSTSSAHAQETVSVNLEVAAEGLTAPLMLTSAPDDTGRRFIVEQIGTIRILEADGTLRGEPFLNIRHKLIDLKHDFDERGLLSMAFHPDFAENGRFYVYYSGHIPDDAGLDRYLWYSHTNYVAEYTVSEDDPNVADRNTARVLLSIDWPQFNHNGGWLGFGQDGYLYISAGDGGYADDYGIGHNKEIGNGQDLTTLLGKILRIDVDAGEGDQYYGIPADNPFVGDMNVEPEIYAYGLRNPWRCSFDQDDGRLFCADVGQNAFEEVNIIEAGGNFGWRVKEGTHCFDWMAPNQHPDDCDDTGMIDPIVEYNNCNVTTDCRGISVTGGYVYRGGHGDWNGTYFFGDWSRTFAPANGQLFAARDNGGDMWDILDVEVGNMDFNSYVLAFGQDGDGEVYVLTSDTTGPVGGLDTIYRIAP